MSVDQDSTHHCRTWPATKDIRVVGWMYFELYRNEPSICMSEVREEKPFDGCLKYCLPSIWMSPNSNILSRSIFRSRNVGLEGLDMIDSWCAQFLCENGSTCLLTSRSRVQNSYERGKRKTLSYCEEKVYRKRTCFRVLQNGKNWFFRHWVHQKHEAGRNHIILSDVDPDSAFSPPEDTCDLRTVWIVNNFHFGWAEQSKLNSRIVLSNLNIPGTNIQ